MTKHFTLACSGRIIEFSYNSSDFYQVKAHGVAWSLPVTNPFLFATIICFFSSIFVTPFLYAAIYRFKFFRKYFVWWFYRFRKKQDENATGISSSSKVLRKSRNLVSMRFNMFNWMLELVSVLLVMIGENPLLADFHNLVNSCGTPMVSFPDFLALSGAQIMQIWVRSSDENLSRARNLHLSL